ncbi:unnamed protein product [Nippostrongylus brasiliensis]|uniref:Polyphosphoinositide phosphatase (inferred by orthology to a human protein) n=1 Tax=Nippostrongylus brasiliensis TaxID=27835 RepID=A0A0N4YC69_NIPBR|nr:unnamed protein product [Nippostrongylus brasiliensis]
MISLAMGGLSISAEEQRYVRLFQTVDLSTDFYFSYTYDLSRSLQENALSSDWDRDGERPMDSDRKFVWNSFLLEPLRNNLVSEQWLLEIVHGYVGQQLINLPFTKLSLTLIGRRSAEYAGTKLLKRGANQKGNVANDVETEQVLWDVSSSPNFSRGRFSSFVQRSGSVPLRWSQDPATRGVVGKPLILIDLTLKPLPLIFAYAIKLGTLENIAAAEDEWVLRSFMNTSKKRQLLSNKEDEDQSIME